MSQFTQESRSTDRNDDVILSISDPQKNQYLSQNFESGKSQDLKIMKTKKFFFCDRIFDCNNL